MNQQPIHLDTHNKISELEKHVEHLQHQQKIIQNIESYVDEYRLDFGDLIETNSILDEEIERYQRQICQLIIYKDIIEAEERPLILERRGL